MPSMPYWMGEGWEGRDSGIVTSQARVVVLSDVVVAERVIKVLSAIVQDPQRQLEVK